ncbi:hypothetical protein Tco_1468579 [Tanacetum coccineum]
MPDLEEVSNAFPNYGIFSRAYDDDDVGAEDNFNNMDNTIDVSPIPTLRVHKDHPIGQILGDPKSAVQTRGKIQKALQYNKLCQDKSCSMTPEGSLIFVHQTILLPIESNKPLVKDEDGVDVDVHIYRSMIGSLMYLTASRPDIMFAVCACARYLNHQPKLGLWYPRDSPFELKAFSDSDYGGTSLDRKSTTSGCQFLAANCCGQVLWIQNQMMDYGFNFMNTKIHIDNESTICIVKNPVYHSRTKHIEIRHHFIRDCYEKRLIDVVKIHTNNNVADLLTKGFDVTRFNFLVEQHGFKNGWKLFLFCLSVSVISLYPRLYALTHNPTVRTLANGTPELVASIDNKEYTITEASVRSKLQLTDAAGAAEDQGESSAIPAEPQHTPTDPVLSTSQPTIPSANEPLPQPSPPRSHKAHLHEGHTSGSAEDSLQLKELMVLVPKLVTRIANLEKELHQTKTTYRKAVLTLVEKGEVSGSSLEKKDKESGCV